MKRLKKYWLRGIAFGLLLVISSVGAIFAMAQIGLLRNQTGVSISMKHGGLNRDYRIHVPKSLRKNTSVPLVLCLHGGGGNSRIASVMGLSQIANREGFIVVYPNAENKHWNDGRDSPMFADHDQKVDDVSFIMKIIERVRAEYTVDPDRIFATGLSNGGFMTQRLAIEESETFAAAAVVIATMGEPLSKRFTQSNRFRFSILMAPKIHSSRTTAVQSE